MMFVVMWWLRSIHGSSNNAVVFWTGIVCYQYNVGRETWFSEKCDSGKSFIGPENLLWRIFK